MEISGLIATYKKQVSLYKKIKNKTCKKYKISSNALDILLLLHSNTEIKTANQICKSIGMKPTMASYDLDKLMKAGYVTVTADSFDRRKNIVSLDDKAIPIITQGLTIQARYKDIIFENVSKEYEEEFYKILDKVVSNVDKCNIKNIQF